MISFISSRRIALRAEEGVTLIITLGVLVVTSALLAAAFTGSVGEIHLTATDRSAKKAYYAAQAGIDEYASHLTQDPNYLTYCTTPTPANPALNQVAEGTTHRVTVPEASDEEYALTLLPAKSAPTSDETCDKNRLVETMIENAGSAAGTFRLESTGFSGGEKATLIATFKNDNFLSYVWYDVYETADPAFYGEKDSANPKAYAECGQFYGSRPGQCTEGNNYFIEGEEVKGPMHTEDHVGICGAPVYGRNSLDRIEFGHGVGDEGYSGEEACAGNAHPNFKGTHIPPKEVPSLKPPPGDEELLHVVEAKYHYNNKTEIILEGNVFTLKEHVGKTKVGEEEKETVTTNVPFPGNGVIYVSGGCSELYSPYGPLPGYTEDTKCGNVYVHGEYTSSLTIASQNDIVINGNITTPHNGEGAPTTSAMLGLVANNFIRVYHPLEPELLKRPNQFHNCGGFSNSPRDLKEPTIYAAMLAVKHSIIVDNFDCGSPSLGSLKVYGAMAALFTNGLTGVFSGSSLIAGYPYAAVYDSRMQAEEPPHFLNPIQAAWYIGRQTECVPSESTCN